MTLEPRAAKLLDGLVDMRDRKNAVQSSLHRAQQILLGAWSLLEDIDDAGKVDVALAGRVTATLSEIGVFLECEKWVDDPLAPVLPFEMSSNSDRVSHGHAPDVA